jgi:ABC-type glycerol-3-phosphate transport system substrate-binding protein
MRFCEKFRRVLVAICSVMLLTSCGRDIKGSGAESDTEDLMAYKEIRYLPEFTDISKEYHALASEGLGCIDGTFYLLKRKYTETSFGYNLGGGQVITYNADTGEKNLLLDQEDMGRKIIAAAPLEDGSVIALIGDRETGYGLCKMNAEGKEIFSRDIPLNEDPINHIFTVDTQGRSYLLKGNEILLFDDRGVAAGKVDISGKDIRNMVCGKDGVVYLYEGSMNQLIPLDFDAAGMGTNTYSVPVYPIRAITAGSTADFLICDDTTVYQYRCEEGELIPLFDLQDSQIAHAYDIDVIGEMGDGRIFLFTRDESREITEIARLTPTPLIECPVKEVLTIGTIDPGSILLESVVSFNKQNEDFAVSVMNYCIGGRGYSEAREALRLDLSIGKGPDLCVLDNFTDSEALFAGGCFTDLSSYLENSQLYGREDFIAQALEACTWQGQLMAIPNYFRLETIVGRTDVVGTEMGWNMDDMISIVRSHPNAVPFDNCSASYIFDVCIRNMLEEFVDLDGKKADFESPKYIEFLNFIKELPDSDGINGELSDWNNWLQEGRALFSSRYFALFTDLQQLEANLGGEYTCIGYPSSDRTPDCIIKTIGAYAVSASSELKDQAWRFIEWSHSTQGEGEPITWGGFPTRVDIFERELSVATDEADGQEESKGMGGIFGDGMQVNYRKMTSDEVDVLYALIESASPERSEERIILEIMKEEAAYLYDGSKTAEEVAKVTQNRVQLYLDE